MRRKSVFPSFAGMCVDGEVAPIAGRQPLTRFALDTQSRHCRRDNLGYDGRTAPGLGCLRGETG